MSKTTPRASSKAARYSSDDYIELELAFAKVLGWKELPRREGELFHRWQRPSGSDAEYRPHWVTSWKDCGPLMTQYGCYPEENGTGSLQVPHKGAQGGFWATTVVSDHLSLDAAARFVIVQAVLAQKQSVTMYLSTTQG